MRTINTDKMDKVTYRNQEIAFGTCRKNEWGEYVVKVYVDGVYDEDKTIYADSREDAEATKAQAIKDYEARNVSLIDVKVFTDMMKGEDEDIDNAKIIQTLKTMTDDELATLGYHTYFLLDTYNIESKKLIAINSICSDILTTRENFRRTQG